jgi:hypothetical protein
MLSKNSRTTAKEVLDAEVESDLDPGLLKFTQIYITRVLE